VNQKFKEDPFINMNNYDQRLGKSMAKESGILRNDYHFQWFLYSVINNLDKATKTALVEDLPYRMVSKVQKIGHLIFKSDPKMGFKFASYVVHFLCSVHSCKEFRYNKNAATEFQHLHQDYIEWSKKLRQE
jgi:hypothetical protein